VWLFPCFRNMGTTNAIAREVLCVHECIYDMFVCVACVRTFRVQDGKRIFEKEKRQEK
jgi:hypothetical protein